MLRQAESTLPELKTVLSTPDAAHYPQWGNLRVPHYPARRLIWQRVPLIDGEQPRGSLIVFREAAIGGQLDIARQSFLSMISHDVRTPLSTILGFAELLYNHRGDLPEDEQTEFLEYIIQNANDLSRYIQIALDIMYLQANTQDFETETVFLSRFVNNWLSDALHRFPTERIIFENGAASDLIAHVAPSALHRILYILAEFALAESPLDNPIVLELNHDQSRAHVVIRHDAPDLSASDALMLFQSMNPRDFSEAGRPLLHRMQFYVACLLAERQQGHLALYNQGERQYQLDLSVPLALTS